MTECVDTKGRRFPSLAAMAREWGIGPHVLNGRLALGWTLAEALGAVPRADSPRHGIPARDHTGRRFASIAAMARAWGINNHTLLWRLNKGWPLEEALEGVWRDHTGRRFQTVAAMAEAWGIRTATLLMRLGRGWELERALSTPAKGPARAVIDHTGRAHQSLSAMARAWDVNLTTLCHRLARGWTLERALTQPAAQRHGKVV